MQALLKRILKRLFQPLAGWLGRTLGKRTYWVLALVLSLMAVADLHYFHYTGGMSKSSFDTMLRYRLLPPKPDPDIVIVDINEASLSAMAKDYGRWPWPRQVLGEFVEHIEKQQPKAIVFDILFSDPDVYNPDSDAYFDEVIRHSDNTYFPMMRLPAESDAASQLKPSMLPGARPIPGQARQDQAIAMILPHFKAALDGGRLGTHNIYTQGDSIARRYVVQRNEYGWQIPSLPARLAQDMGQTLPDGEDMLINWRGAPFSYRTLSFSDVYADFLNQQHKRLANEFAGKIIIIGSTAPSLFDIKATPMAELFPGVEILATAIDNLKNRDYLKEQPLWVTALLAILLIWGSAAAFYYRKADSRFDSIFAGVQFGILGLSYAALNLSSYYIDITAPVAFALLYFSVARSYAFFSDAIREERELVFTGPHPGQSCRMDILVLQIKAADARSKARFEAQLAPFLEPSAGRSAHFFNDHPGIFAKMFDNTLLLYWLHETDGGAPISGMPVALTKLAAASGCQIAIYMHSGVFDGDAEQHWQVAARRIASQALLAANSEDER